MKKHLIFAAALLICALLFTGCQCSHEWAEADCVSAKTCTKCDVTEGEALGHDWLDATCAAPKTCSRCAVTEGEALAHTWQDATYQSAKTCTACAATEGEALTADFAALGLEIDADATGTPCSFTAGGKPFTASIISWDTFTAAEVTDAMLSHYTESPADLEGYLSHVQDLEGYEWKVVRLSLEGSDISGMNEIPVLADYGDYYDIEGQVNSLEEGTDHPTRFTVNFRGQDYTDCAYCTFYTINHDGSRKVLTIDQWMYFRMPAGYDGLVVSCGDVNTIQNDYYSNYMNYYTDANTVFFRIK